MNGEAGTKTLQTKRMLLRKVRASDSEDLYCAGILGTSREEADEITGKMVQEYAETRCFHWALEHNGRAIGRVKGWEVDLHNDYVQLGYDIGAEYRNKGLMTEAIEAILSYLLLEADFHRVYCMVRSSNVASLRVCQKAGMHQEGVLREHFREPDGSWVDVYVYGKVK